MPVEIREIVIRAIVTPPEAPPSVSSDGASPPGTREGGIRHPSDNRDEIIMECVEKVLDILKKQKER
jgi:hypothetical protein